MTVSELIAELKDFPPDAPVVMASDEEGNSYHQLYEVACGSSMRVIDDKFVEIGLTELEQSDRDRGYSEEDVLEGGTPCAILWPT